jgi:hypothetical protein
MKRLAVLPLAAVLALGTGCKDSPTGPGEEPIPLVISAELLAEVVAAVDDALLRILPALQDAGRTEQLRDHLQALRQSVSARDRGAAQQAHARAQAVLIPQSATLGDPADVGAIQLVLDATGDLLRASSASR